MGKYFPAIGLEIHLELKTKSKMFCSCRNDPEEKRANVNICPICLGYPGSLPSINEEAIKKALKVGKALNCKIAKTSFFERKNYFYPDLPKGYQISQYSAPLCYQGYLEIESKKGMQKKVKIRRIHLEEDTAKLIHKKDSSLVDFNRAGVPLMELVTEPDITSAKEARKFAEELHLILRYLDVSDAQMEKGQMRIEANVSLSKEKGKLGTKVEIKNLNSFREVERAIEFEIERQREILKEGKEVIQETRGWDDLLGKTFPQREKEEAYDYRYFPEPDLPPLDLEKFLSKISLALPELPRQRCERYQREFFIPKKECEILIREKELADFFEASASELELWMKDENLPLDSKKRIYLAAIHLLLSDLKGILVEKKLDFQKMKLTPENFAELIVLLWEGKISIKVAKSLIERMVTLGGDPSQIIEEEKLIQIQDKETIEKIVKEVILENPKAVQDYKKGKVGAIHFLFGKAMGKAKGKLNPQILKKILEEKLKK